MLGADYGSAHAGAARRKILPFASTRSVFGGDSSSHREARARIAPALSQRALAPKRPAIEEIAARHAAGWPRGRPFRLLERMRELTDEVFVRLVLGVRDEELALDLIAAVRSMLNVPGNPPLTLPGRGDGLAGELGQRLFERRQAQVARNLARAVGKARRRRRRGEAGDDAPDVLGLMVAAEPRLETGAIVEELMSLLMAAQEPPAIALTWLLDRIAREQEPPRFMDRETNEERRQAVVKETLRLQPPASAALRRLAEPLEASGFTLPAGADALLPTSLMQRDLRHWERGDSFNPERWGSEPPPGFYFPFGGGERRCVGEPLARAEIDAIVPAVLRTVDLRPLSSSPERMVQRATVLVPRRGIPVLAGPPA